MHNFSELRRSCYKYDGDFCQPQDIKHCKMASIMGNWKETASRATFTGVVAGAASIGLYGSEGGGNLSLINVSVPSFVQMGTSAAAGSVAADLALNAATNAGIGSTGWERMAIGLGVAGGVTAYFQEGAAGSYTENFVIGGLSYWAGDKVNANVYQSPGMLM